jgi:hypothetical protein
VPGSADGDVTEPWLVRPQVIEKADLADDDFSTVSMAQDVAGRDPHQSVAHCRNANLTDTRREKHDMAQAKTTTDHNKIRKWAEQRGGVPSSVTETGNDGDPGILRLDFKPKDEELGKIRWEDFFEKFEKENLAFLYQDQADDGSESRFHKFVQRESR